MNSNEKTETEYQLAQPVNQPAAGGVVVDGVKQGHKCCGGCCDMRRAVIVVDTVNVCVVALQLMSILAVTTASANMDVDAVDDDSVKQALQDLPDVKMGAVYAILGINIVCSALGIMGALKYSTWMVGTAGAWYFVMSILSLIGLNIAGVIYNGFFAYPHVFLVQEIRKGIMTPENYPNEEHSCCCV
ncbi:hypothetical protein ACA910_020016 [Epithemia clementina (nom. ined.)]